MFHEEVLYQVYAPLPYTYTYTYLYFGLPHAGSGVARMDPLRFLAGCRTRRLNQA